MSLEVLDTSASSPQLEFNTSIMNFIDPHFIQSLGWPAHAYVDFLHEAGYQKLEWHPLRLPLAAVQINNGLITNYVKEAIGSLHQGWRGEHSIFQAFAHEHPMIAVGSFFLLAEKIKSLELLDRVQRNAGKKLTTVVYPYENDEKDRSKYGRDYPFAETLFQPTVEVMRLWGARNPDDMMTRAHRHGFSGIALDLHHMRREHNGLSMGKWQHLLPQLLPHTKEVHVAAGRLDATDDKIPTFHELEELSTGQGNSELLQMLKFIHDSGWKGPLVVEVPLMAIHQITSGRLTKEKVVYQHRRISDSLRNIFAG